MIKSRKKTIIASALAACAITAAAFGLSGISSNGTSAYADNTQTLDGTTVFYTGVRGAEISNSLPEGEEGDQHVYTTFQIGKDQEVSYRRNYLAYSWIEGVKDEDGNYTGSQRATFSMEIGFSEVNFERYIIKFQSQQYTLTEETVSDNYLVFTPSTTAGAVDLSIVQELEDDTALTPVATALTGHIKISFGEYVNGNYEILVNDSTTSTYFKNVYEGYASYVTSGDSAAMPITFSATFAESDTNSVAEMILYELNKQSFELTEVAKDSSGNTLKDGDKVLYETTVTDNAPPVMCFDETPSYLEYGQTISFSFKVIDVLSNNTRYTAHYYILSGEQYEADDFDYDKYDYSSDTASEDTSSDDTTASEGEGEGTGEATTTKTWTNPFKSASSSSSTRLIRDDDTFVPYNLQNSGVYGLAKIYYEISDRTSGNNPCTDYVFADWYAKDSALVDIYSAEYKNVEGKSSSFIKVISLDDYEKLGKSQGATYAQHTYTDEELSSADVLQDYKDDVAAFQAAYQKKIDEAIAAMDDGKLYAGADSKFYLPDFGDLKDENGNALTYDLAALDEYNNVSDYTFAIYYSAASSSSTSALASNKLALTLSSANVTYRFTLYITDSFGNTMRYPSKDEDGNLVWNEIETGDVWDEDFADLLPFFEIDVYYKPATAEPPETLSVAYVNTSYSGVSFTIKGVADTYDTEYNLYVFDRNAMYNETGVNLSYERFVANIDNLFNNKLDDIEEFTDKTVHTRKYFKTVKVASELISTDVDYDEYKDLNWNATSISFTPRSVNDYYVVSLTLTDKLSSDASTSKTTVYTAVAASIETTALKGEDDWAENNKTSIILFSIAGVCAIAVIALFIIRPKDRKDIDEEFNDLENKKSAKKKGKKASSGDESGTPTAAE